MERPEQTAGQAAQQPVDPAEAMTMEFRLAELARLLATGYMRHRKALLIKENPAETVTNTQKAPVPSPTPIVMGLGSQLERPTAPKIRRKRQRKPIQMDLTVQLAAQEAESCK